MANKGQIMTQVHYDKQVRYLKLLQESFGRGEVSQDEAVKALSSMGFSADISVIKVREWSSNMPQFEPEIKGVMNKRLKETSSLGKYFLKKREHKKKIKKD